MEIVSRVRIGMTRDEVLAVLGVPDDTSIPRRKNLEPDIFKYGEIELHFGESGKLWLVYTEVCGEDGERETDVLLR